MVSQKRFCKFRKRGYRYLVLLLSAVFITIMSTPTNAQTILSATNQHLSTEQLLPLQSQRFAQTLGGQLAVFIGHQRSISSVQFNPDGRYVVTASDDRTARIWDRNGNLLVILEHPDQVDYAEFSPDSSQILTFNRHRSYLWDAQGNLLATLQGARIVKFNSSGDFILTVGYARKVAYLWSRQGDLIAELSHEGDIDIADFSPDGRRVLTGGRDQTVKVWDTSGNSLARFQHDSRIMSATFSPDSRFILTTSFRSHVAYLWDVGGNLISRIEDYSDSYGHIELDNAKFSPDGEFILTFDSRHHEGIHRLWNRHGNYITLIQGHESYVNTTEFSPDNRYILTASDDGTARLWNTQGETIVVLHHGQPVQNAEFSPNGRYLLTTSGSSWDDKTIRIWDQQGNLLAAFRYGDNIDGVEFAPAGDQLILWGNDIARLWNTSTVITTQPQQTETLQVFEERVAEQNAQIILLEHERTVDSAEFSPDGNYILTRTFNGTTPRLWDRRGTLLSTFQGQGASVQSAQFSPDGNYILTTTLDNTVSLFSRDGNSLFVLPSSGRQAIFSPDSHYILISSAIRSRLVDREGSLVAEFQGHSATFSPDGDFILTAFEETVYLWDKMGNLVTEFTGHEYGAHHPRFSPDGRYIFTADYFQNARLWDRQGNLLSQFHHEGEVIRVNFSPNNRYALIFSYHPLQNPTGSLAPTAELWSIEGGDRAILGFGRVTSAKFSPDGQYILITSLDKPARLLDENGNLLSIFQHDQRVESAIFSPDGNFVVTTSTDRTARLWSLDGNLLAILRGHETAITGAVFSADSQQLITVSRDNTARLWNISVAIATQAEQVASMQSSQATLLSNNNQQANTMLQEAIQLDRQGTIASRQLAIQSLTASLNLYQLDQNLSQAAQVSRYIGDIQLRLGEFQNALDSYTEALRLSRQAGAVPEEATILNSLGQLYYNLASLDIALSYYSQALPLLYQLNDRGGAAITLNSIGAIVAVVGNYEEALQSHNQALALSQASGNKASEASALMGIGSVYAALEQWSSALNIYGQALIVTRFLSDQTKESEILNQLGAIHAILGDNATAFEHYNQALELAQQLAYKTEEANIFYNRARLNRQQNNFTAAKTDIENAIQIIESLRSQIGSQTLRQSYFARNQAYYQFYIDLLMQLHQQTPNQGYDALALHISERARARSLLEQLTEASLNLRADLDPALLAEEQHLTQALNVADQQRIDLLNSSYSNSDLEVVKAEIDGILQQLQRLEAQIRQANPAYANLNYPDPLTLAEIQSKILDDRTLLLQYALGTDRSYLFLVSKTSLKTYTLPPKVEIEEAVEAYRALLQSPNFTDLSQGQQLSQMLLGQLANELTDQRLVIVGDGKLQLLPFAALPWVSETSPAPLLTHHEIITLPSATSLAVQREQWQQREPAAKTIAVIADPVFQATDPRFGGNTTPIAGDLSQYETLIRNSCGDFDRLPHTATEAEQILALVPASQHFSAQGFDANYATATAASLSQYQIVHLATHGCIQDNPLLSNLALSFFQPNGQRAETSLLKLQDIYNLKLNAELVVLSACQTGTGQEIQGEGVVGLTRGFMYAGARRVLVSLWSVSDRATSTLMSDYYRQMLQQGLDPSVALQQAQLTMWQSGNHSAPYYWAAFTIQGDW